MGFNKSHTARSAIAFSLDPGDDLCMSKNKSEIDLSVYRKDIVTTLMQELFKLVGAEERAHGKEFADQVVMDFLASYTSTVVLNSLVQPTAIEHPDPQMRFVMTLDNFLKCKRAMEDAISIGFEGGMTAFNPNSVPDYQCDITCLDDGLGSKITN